MKVTVYVVKSVNDSGDSNCVYEAPMIFETYKKARSFYARQAKRVRCGDTHWSVELERLDFEGSPRAVINVCAVYASRNTGGSPRPFVSDSNAKDATLITETLDKELANDKTRKKRGLLT